MYFFFLLPCYHSRLKVQKQITISTRQAAACCTWEQGHQVSCHHYLLLICWHLNQEVLTPLQGDYISMQCVTVSFLLRRLHSSRVRPTFSYMYSKTGRKKKTSENEPTTKTKT